MESPRERMREREYSSSFLPSSKDASIVPARRGAFIKNLFLGWREGWVGDGGFRSLGSRVPKAFQMLMPMPMPCQLHG